MPLLPALLSFVALQGAWKTYTLGPGFQVDMPTPPQANSSGGRDMGKDGGVWVSMHQARNTVVFGYEGIKPNEPTPPDIILRNAVMGATDGMRAKLTAQRDILLEGWPGVEFRVSNAEGLYGIGRTYIVPGGIAQLIVAGTSEKALDAPATKYFASLKLPAAIGKGALKIAGPEFKPHPIPRTSLKINFPKPPKEETSEFPGPPKMTMYRHTADYMNRMFMVMTMELPEETMNTMDPEGLEAFFGQLHDSTVEAAGGIKAQTAPGKLGEREVRRTTFWPANGLGYCRLDSFIVGRRVFVLVAAVPAPLSKSPEIDAFFNSAQLD